MKSDYGTEPIKNSLERMRNYFCGGPQETQKLFLITKEDGSQRYIRAVQCEFYESTKEAYFYQKGQFCHGTYYSHVIDVREVTEDE